MSRDRPLSRKLVKLGFAALGRGRAHWQDTWPGLRVIRDADGAGEILWKGQPTCPLLPFSAFAARVGTEITVVGSGPSLRDQHPERIAPGALLLNGAALLAEQVPHPLALVVEDERFIHRHGAIIRNSSLPLLASPGVIRALLTQDTTALNGRDLWLIDNLAKPVHATRRPLPDWVVRDHNAALSPHPETGVVPAGTVAFSALQFALASGAQTIALAGIDLTNTDQPRFYETSESAPTGIDRAQTPILAHIRLAMSYATERGQNLLCLSPTSALREIGMAYDNRLT